MWQAQVLICAFIPRITCLLSAILTSDHGDWINYSISESCPTAPACMEDAHASALPCWNALGAVPAFNSCMADSSVITAAEDWQYASSDWHSVLHRCLFGTSDRTTRQADSEPNRDDEPDDADEPSARSVDVAACFQRHGEVMNKCHKDLKKACPAYARCFTESAGFRRIKQVMSQRFREAMQDCINIHSGQ